MRVLPILLTSSIVIGAAGVSASAAPINGYDDQRNYVKQAERRTSNDITGVKTSLTGGWDSVQPGTLAASGNRTFVSIQKNMWAVFSKKGSTSPDCYIEVLNQNNNTSASIATAGQAAGFAQMIAPSYKGIVVAITEYDQATPSTTYGQVIQKSIVYGGNASATYKTGGNLELTQAGPAGQWQARVNGTIVYDRNLVCAERINNQNVVYKALPAHTVEWGIESNDTTNTFTKGTKMTAERRLQGGSYGFPPAAAMSVQPYQNNVNWTSTYTPANGQITFTRP